jgi:hypothetical protein
MKPNNESLLFITGIVFILILINHNLNACPLSHATSNKDFVLDDNNLVIIDNAKSIDLTYDSLGQADIKIEPADRGKTFVYGEDQLTIIESTPLGVVSY